jgi:hypothetical protein
MDFMYQKSWLTLTDQETVTISKEWLQKETNSANIELFEWSLAAKIYSPKVAAMWNFQGMNETLCSLTIQYESMVHCWTGSFNHCPQSTIQPLSLDHIYGPFSSLVAYGDPLNPKMYSQLASLKSWSQKHNCGFIYRYLKPNSIIPPEILSGYGVELMIKNSEYKVLDDRQTASKILSI